MAVLRISAIQPVNAFLIAALCRGKDSDTGYGKATGVSIVTPG